METGDVPEGRRCDSPNLRLTAADLLREPHMPEKLLQIRRGRRTDFTDVMRLLAGSGLPVPPPDRATLRRFRHIVADLGSDFYLALMEGVLAGLVHVTYTRRLATLPDARLDQLIVAEAFRRRGVGSALWHFARERARRRGCDRVFCVTESAVSGREFIIKSGLQPRGEWFAQVLGMEQ